MKAPITKTMTLAEARAQFEALLNNMQQGEAYELALSLDESGEVAVQLFKTQDSTTRESKGVQFGKFTGTGNLPTDKEWAAMDKDIERDFDESDLLLE